MKKCTKCGYEAGGALNYCPMCGQLLPGNKQMILVDAKEYHQVVNDAYKVQYDAADWIAIKSFYQIHLKTGYAPNGKQLIAKTELQQLRKDNREYEEAARANGTHIVISGRLVCRAIPIHQKVIRYMGFKKFWKYFIKKDPQNYLWCLLIYWLIVFSHVLCISFSLVFLAPRYGLWSVGACAAIAIPCFIGYIYVGGRILDIS